MDERTKQLFKVHVGSLNSKLDSSYKLHTCAAYAACELIMLYSEIAGIPYDDAAKILHEEGE